MVYNVIDSQTGICVSQQTNLKKASRKAESNPWTIRFSGRTQREAICSELPWIGNRIDVNAA